MGRRAYATPDRSWPTLLRHALRARLVARGRTIPEGLKISFRKGPPGGPDGVDIRNDPCATASVTRFSYIESPIGIDGQATEAFLEAAVRHADTMRREQARLDALVAAGHPPRLPPRHAVEAHPVVALALRLADQGRAGISGDLGIGDGVMWARELDITVDGVSFGIRTATTARLRLHGTWPDTLTMISDMPLSSVLELPTLGREAVDAAVRALRIRRSWKEGGVLVLELEATPVVSIDDTPTDEDGRWKGMEPIPMA